ncbi:MAG: TonB-dependent receptor [Candidatus Omnitrophota bacterium]|nr:TonB-dependent receptor [Candidatus Omnitrophota bacterium]
MKKILRVFIFFLIIFPCAACADEAVKMEKIVVTSRRDPSAGGTSAEGFPIQALGSADISQAEPNALPDLFNNLPGLDLRYRGTYGIQGDLSVRGSTFEQSAVLIDGIKVNDPQTGHYNMDIPLTVFDVERIGINKSGYSARYGSGAFAGETNIITGIPQKKALKLNFTFGEHALSTEAFSLSYPYGSLLSRVSYEHALSKAARPNTDFEYHTASFYLNKEFGQSTLDSLFGYQKKDYGADSFYSNLYKEEEEHTETFFTKVGVSAPISRGTLKNNLYLRRHWDKFILNRNRPTSVNYHTNYIYGLNSLYSLPLAQARLSLGIDLGDELINSTNIGKHSRSHEAALFGITLPLIDKLNTGLGARVDHYQKWGAIGSYNAGAGFDILKDKLKIKGSFSRSFRLPSFTELYYSDAANRGDADLKKETADNFSAGLDFKQGCMSFNFEGFLRRGSNLIDYTRASVNDIWQATNLGRVDFSGVEAGLRANIGGRGKIFALKEASFSYAYQTADKKADGFLSKYALDILQNRAILGIFTGILGLDFNLELSYTQRYYGSTYISGDVYLGKKIANKAFSMEPFVKVDNFTDANCVDIAGVLLPGRWVKSGLKFEW